MTLEEQLQTLWKTARKVIEDLDFLSLDTILTFAEDKTILEMINKNYQPSEHLGQLIRETYHESMLKGRVYLEDKAKKKEFEKAITALPRVKEYARKAKVDFPHALEKQTYALGVQHHLVLVEKWLLADDYAAAKESFDAASLLAGKSGISIVEYAPLLERIGKAGIVGELEKARDALYGENALPTWEARLERAADYAKIAKMEKELPMHVKHLIAEEFDQLVERYKEYLSSMNGIDAKAHADRLYYYATITGKELPQEIKKIQQHNDFPSFGRIN